MNTPQLERMCEHSHRLRLYQIENELTARLEQAAKKEISYADFLDDLLTLERRESSARALSSDSGAIPSNSVTEN